MNDRDHQQYLLRSLARARKIHLDRKLRHYNSVEKSAGKVAGNALEKLLQKEAASGLAAVFGASPKRGGNGGSSGPAGAALSGQPAGGGFNPGQMETTMDRMVASSLVNGRQTSTVLRSLFGLVPSLIGR